MTITIPADVKRKAYQVHSDAFVYDFSPLGEPFIPSDESEAAMKRAMADGAEIPGILRAMQRARLRELEESAEVRDLVSASWRASGVNAVQVTLGGLSLSPSDWAATVRDAAYWHGRVRASDDMAICTTANDLLRAKDEGRIGIVLGTQDAAQIGLDLDRLDLLHDVGVRVVQLTFNTRNLLGDGCTERNQSGLSKFGLAALDRMNELGIVPDASHTGTQTTLDIIEHSRKPVAITHASCQSVAEHPRAKSDEELRTLRDNDGYIGILAVPFFIAPDGEASLETLVDHVEYAADVVGVDRVGIGTDWGGWTPDFPAELKGLARDKLASHGFGKGELPPFGAKVDGLDSWEAWPNISASLLARGFSEGELRGLIGDNWLSFLRRAI